MDNIRKTRSLVRNNSSKSGHEKKEREQTKFPGTNYESRFNTENTLGFCILDDPSNGRDAALSGYYPYQQGVNGVLEFKDGELPSAEPSALTVSVRLGNTEEAGSLGFDIDKSGVENGKALLATTKGSLPKQPKDSESGSLEVSSHEITGKLCDHMAYGDLLVYCGDVIKLSMTSPQHHRGSQSLGSETRTASTTQEFNARDIVDLGCSSPHFRVVGGPDEPMESDNKSYVHHQVEPCTLGGEPRTHEVVPSFGVDPGVERVTHISFKQPGLKILDIGSLGFSFCPRFEKVSTSSNTQGLRPTLNPFEDIERQGRCSPLNHSRSPPGSRHHSRSSSLGLQAFRPLPLAMKISKETGDQPPIIPSPPPLSYSEKNICGFVRGMQGLETTLAAEVGPLFGDRSRECKTNIEGVLELNDGQIESLDIKDFDILFSLEQKLEPSKYPSNKRETKGSGLSNLKLTSNKNLHSVNQSGFATLGVKSTSLSTRVDRGKLTVKD